MERTERDEFKLNCHWNFQLTWCCHWKMQCFWRFLFEPVPRISKKIKRRKSRGELIKFALTHLQIETGNEFSIIDWLLAAIWAFIYLATYLFSQLAVTSFPKLCIKYVNYSHQYQLQFQLQKTWQTKFMVLYLIPNVLRELEHKSKLSHNKLITITILL